MTEVVSKIKRLRTFSGDVMDARGGLSVPETVTPKVVMPPAKVTPLVTVIPPATKTTSPKLEMPLPKPVPPPPPPPPKPTTPPSPVNLVVKPESVPAVTTAPKPDSPKLVPEILKEDLSTFNKPVPTSILAASPNRIDVMESENNISSGSIISDHKKHRFNLFTATWQALKEWFVAERVQFEKKQAEKAAAIPKVRPVESRKEVVMKAASQSALAPKNDQRKVVPRVKAEAADTPTKPEAVITIKSRDAVPTPSWSHFQGEESAVSTPPKTSVTPEVKPAVVKAITLPPPPPPPPPPKPVPPPPPVIVTVPTPAVEKPTEVIKPTIVAPVETKLVEPTPEPIKTPPVPEVKTVAKLATVPSYSPSEATAEEPQTAAIQDVQKEDTVAPLQTAKQKPIRFAAPKPSPFPIIRVATIAVMSIVLGISVSLWLFGGNKEINQEVAGQEEIVALIKADQTVDVPVTNDRDEFLEQLTNTSVPVKNAVSLLRPRINLSGTTSTAPTVTVLQLLNLKWPGSFTRSIETINFGRYDGRSFIVLRVTSFDAGFSGLLESESSLIADFYPLFGTPVAGTFDPSLRTLGGVGEAVFVDSTVKNHDVRILRDELQKERLVYGFVNRNTILITTDSTAFAAVADKIK